MTYRRQTLSGLDGRGAIRFFAALSGRRILPLPASKRRVASPYL